MVCGCGIHSLLRRTDDIGSAEIIDTYFIYVEAV